MKACVTAALGMAISRWFIIVLGVEVLTSTDFVEVSYPKRKVSSSSMNALTGMPRGLVPAGFLDVMYFIGLVCFGIFGIVSVNRRFEKR